MRRIKRETEEQLRRLRLRAFRNASVVGRLYQLTKTTEKKTKAYVGKNRDAPRKYFEYFDWIFIIIKRWFR